MALTHLLWSSPFGWREQGNINCRIGFCHRNFIYTIRSRARDARITMPTPQVPKKAQDVTNVSSHVPEHENSVSKPLHQSKTQKQRQEQNYD